MIYKVFDKKNYKFVDNPEDFALLLNRDLLLWQGKTKQIFTSRKENQQYIAIMNTWLLDKSYKELFEFDILKETKTNTLCMLDFNTQYNTYCLRELLSTVNENEYKISEIPMPLSIPVGIYIAQKCRVISNYFMLLNGHTFTGAPRLDEPFFKKYIEEA